MTFNEMFPILKDEQGNSIKCACKGCRRMARHIHHKTPRCQGGTNEAENLVALCDKCHKALHSAAGDFSRWGRIGGTITAQRGVSIPNLVQFRGEAGAARYAAWLERRAMQQMGVA